MKPRFCIVPVMSTALLVISLLVVGCSPSAQPSASNEGEKSAKPAGGATTMTIGSAGIGSNPYVMAVGISNLVNKQYKDIQTSVEPSGGSDAIIRSIAEKGLDSGIANSMTAGDAYFGRGVFKQKMPIRLIAQGDASLQNIVARVDSGIKTPVDLKGKKIIGKRKALATLEEVTLAVIKVWGVPKDEVKILEAAEAQETIEAVKIGTADAATLLGSAGSGQLKDLSESTAVVFLDLGPKMDELLKELNPGYFAATIPAGVYKGTDKPVKSVAAGRTGFFVRADMPEETVYKIAKTIFSNPEEFNTIHATARQWTPENTLDSFPLPFHPGTVKYLKEAGKWTDAAEKRQQELAK